MHSLLHVECHFSIPKTQSIRRNSIIDSIYTNVCTYLTYMYTHICSDIYTRTYSLLHVEGRFSNLKTHSIIESSTSLLTRSGEKRPVNWGWRMRLNEIGWDWTCTAYNMWSVISPYPKRLSSPLRLFWHVLGKRDQLIEVGEWDWTCTAYNMWSVIAPYPKLNRWWGGYD